MDRDRPRPGRPDHARTGHQGRAPRTRARDHASRQGHGRQARPRGARVPGVRAEPAARSRHHLRARGRRPVRVYGVRHRRVRAPHRRMGVRHGDHGARYIGTVCTTRVLEYGMLPSTGTVGDSYDNAMAESVNGAYKTELVWRRKPFQDLRDLELATFRWVSWRGLEASAPVLGLQDTGSGGNRVLREPSGTSRPTIRAEQNQAIPERLTIPR